MTIVHSLVHMFYLFSISNVSVESMLFEIKMIIWGDNWEIILWRLKSIFGLI